MKLKCIAYRPFLNYRTIFNFGMLKINCHFGSETHIYCQWSTNDGMPFKYTYIFFLKLISLNHISSNKCDCYYFNETYNNFIYSIYKLNSADNINGDCP